MLGEKIKKLRIKNHIKQEDICNYFKVARGTVSMWETNKREPDIATLKKLANYFNVSIDYLVENETDTTKIQLQPQYTEQQKNCIDMLMQLTQKQLDRVEAYLTAQIDAKEEIKKEIK